MMAERINADIPKSIAKFEALINKILPKKIFYKLLFRGKGLEFDCYRQFAPDDDASFIDWKASIRGNTLLAKQYIEEKDLRIMFVVDVSENMVFGSQEKLKCEYATEVCAALSHVIINTGDRVGFILFSNEIISISLPGGGKRQFDLFVNTLADTKTYRGYSDINIMLDKLLMILNKSINLVIIISDFVKVNEEHYGRFEELGNMYETFAIIVRDPLDMTLPNLNKEVVIEDSKTGQKLVINPKLARSIYETNARIQLELVKDIFKRSNIDSLEMNTRDDFALNLATFLKRRVERR